MKKIDAVNLGATLFVPAIHKHMQAIAHGKKFPALRSVVFDTEDGIREDDLEAALSRIAFILPELTPGKLLRFIRPRSPEVLQNLFAMNGIENIDGFVLPKFGLDNAKSYLMLIQNSSLKIKHYIMPSIEGDELFDIAKLQQLRDILLPYREQIITIRFGAEDMLRQLGLRRDCTLSLYDMTAPSQVIANLLMTFKPYGFNLSAPVYRCYREDEMFAKEVQRDLQEGLLSKTIIHPDQIDALSRLYRVSQDDLDAATAIVHSKKAVFSVDGTMGERTTQRPWALQILKRARVYGVSQRSNQA